MAKKTQEKIGFNLLISQIEPPTLWTKIYDWMVGSARIVMISIELVVIVAFGLRVFLDVESKNLDEEIANKENILRAFQSSEVRFRKIQDHVNAYAKSWEEASVHSSVYAEVNTYLPQNPVEMSVQIDTTTVVVSGTASGKEIAFLENAFKNSSTFRDAQLVKLDIEGTSGDSLGNFTIVAAIRNPEKRQINNLAQDQQVLN
jgi:hypothetical protein